MVLSRFPGEKIIVGDNIIIEIVEIRNGASVRVGITAPDDVQVDREEVRDRIAAESRLAALRQMDEPPRPLAGGLDPHPVRRDARRANGEARR